MSVIMYPTPFTLRPYQADDAAAVVQVVNAAAAITTGTTQAIVDGAGHVRLARYVPLASERVVVHSAQGDIVGCAYLTDAEQGIVYQVGGAVHPAYQGQGIGTSLLIWAEDRARALSQQRAPHGIRTLLQVNLFANDSSAITLFTQRGYIKAREWLHMDITLDTAPPPPNIPDGLYLRPMNLEDDWDIVGPAMDDAFADHWGAITLPEDTPAPDFDEPALSETQELLEDESYSNTPGFCFILLDGETVAGGVLCNRKLVESESTARVGSLFVRPQYRRQGVGRALMLAAFGAFWHNGVRRIINDTDAASFTSAPAFYTQLGMRPYRREYLYEKEIRAGRDIRKLVE